MKLEVDVHLTPELLAKAFVGWSDEEQAEFFIEVAKIAKDWEGRQELQWVSVGRHLRTCKCATPESQDMVIAIALGIQGPKENR